jgi:hypothetical protein
VEPRRVRIFRICQLGCGIAVGCGVNEGVSPGALDPQDVRVTRYSATNAGGDYDRAYSMASSSSWFAETVSASRSACRFAKTAGAPWCMPSRRSRRSAPWTPRDVRPPPASQLPVSRAPCVRPPLALLASSLTLIYFDIRRGEVLSTNCTRPHMNSTRFSRTRYSVSGFVPSPNLSRTASKHRSRRFGDRAASAAASAPGISLAVRSVQ